MENNDFYQGGEEPGDSYWITKEGKFLTWDSMSTKHLNNAANLLRKRFGNDNLDAQLITDYLTTRMDA